MYKTIILKFTLAIFIVLLSLGNLSANDYVNDMDYVLGDVKQAFIQNKISTEAQVENLIKGFKAMGVNGIRIPIFADGQNPNPTMMKYFYNQAMINGFLIFANPAQSSGGQRIANGILNGDTSPVLDDIDATNRLIYRIMAFSHEYKCKWVNPFNEDGAPGMAFSAAQMNTIYSTLQNNVNGAELVGSCVWGIPAGIKVMNQTNISDYITVATTHNLGFNHGQWSTFIAAAQKKNLPVWDSEVNHNDKYGTGTRLETALENKVDGLVLYNSWNTINLTTGAINNTAKSWMNLYLKNNTNTIKTSALPEVKVYPNPTSNAFTVANAQGAKFLLFDAMGKALREVYLKSNQYSIDITGVKPGVYFISIEKDGSTVRQKIIKQ